MANSFIQKMRLVEFARTPAQNIFPPNLTPLLIIFVDSVANIL